MELLSKISKTIRYHVIILQSRSDLLQHMLHVCSTLFNCVFIIILCFEFEMHDILPAGVIQVLDAVSTWPTLRILDIRRSYAIIALAFAFG